MSNTTDTYWEINGVSLNTLGFNIETWGGDREAPPVMRGSNVMVPYRPGDTFVEKVPDTRYMSLGMWVIGATEDGGIPPAGTSQRTQFETNWAKLRSLLFNNGRPFTLTKRFRRTGSILVTSASTQAEYTGGLSLNMTGTTRGIFTVDLKLAEPFFLGDEVVVNFTSATRTQNLTVLGDYDTTYVKWVINGTVSKPAFWNNTLGQTLTVDRTFGPGEVGTIDVDKFRAIHTTAGPVNTKFHGNLTTPVNDPFWFRLRPGLQALQVTLLSGTGLVQLMYKPRWI